jgi:feruloyl esterase
MLTRILVWAVPCVIGIAAEPVLAATCESLTSLSLPHATITRAETVAAGQLKAEGERGPAAAFAKLPVFCRVAATSTPSADSTIKLEVWLPAASWNGKLLGTGNGAWGGSIGRAALADGLARGYAVVGTDTGHEGQGASFAAGHPEKLRDFAERAVHEMTVVGKAIVAAHYGRPHELAYFNGCSTGGRQALTAAQRFPDDFDGIIAGSPGNYTSRQAVGQVWIAQAMQKDPASNIPPAKLATLHDAVIRACDMHDGVADGVLENPRRCAFDPATIACSGPDGAACLTRPQVEAARKIYAGAVAPRDGQPIFPGLEPGGELGWARWGSAQPAEYATEFFKHIAFGDSNWHFNTLDFERDLRRSDEAGAVLDAIDPDLGRFASRGGKLILYAGWSDPGIPPRNLVNYYERVEARMGDRANGLVRLFMVPGMAHCGGGDGTSTFDMLSALEAWREKQSPPLQIPAARVENGVTNRTRPLCPYPQVATYKGTGSFDEAANFACRLQRAPN